MKKYNSLILLVFLVQSCQYFEKNVPEKQDLLNQEIKHINWTVIDEYPSTMLCDSIQDKEARKICFFDFLTQKIQGKLTSDSLINNFKSIDTLNIKVAIDAQANLTFRTTGLKTAVETRKIDSIIAINLYNLTIVEPGIKRGIKVKTEFVLPIVLKK